MSECDCCPAKAKYNVDGEKACGRHLAYMVDLICRMSPHQVKVEKIKISRELKNEQSKDSKRTD